MATNNEGMSLNFSIEETSEMGMGNTELLKDLMSSETVTTEATDLEEIVKEVPEEKKEGKPVTKVKEVKEEETAEQDVLANFLNQSDDDLPEEEEEVIKTEKKEEEEEESQEVSQFTALAKDLFKLGVFQKDEGEEDVAINTPEEFLDRFNTESRKKATEMIDNFLGQFGEDYKNAFVAIYEKGVNPKEYFEIYNKVVDFASLDLAQESNQVKVMEQALLDQGFEPEDITAEIDRLKNFGELENVAARHHKALVKKEAIKLQQKEQEAELEAQQRAALKSQYIKNVQQILQDKVKEKEFDGIPINVKLANELQDFLLVDKWRTPSGETLTEFDKAILELKNPENHAMKVKVALLLQILKKDPKLTTIQRSAVTKKSDQLFSEVARQVSGKKEVSTKTSNSSWKL